jgi:tetratricopeptide (TPR) repeat protein
MMSQVKQLNPPTTPVSSSADPIVEARKKALTTLAEVLFDYSDDSPVAQTRRGLSAIVRGTGQLSLHQAEQTKIILHLGQAIDAQTKNQESLAADELEGALEAGFDHPALYFNLGLLRSKTERTESALRSLGHAVKHVDFALGARLLMGDVLTRMGRISEASIEYLEALKLADSAVVPENYTDEVRQFYEPLIEAQSSETNETAQLRLCKNIRELLMRADWRNHLVKAREQLPRSQEGETPLPLAEVIIQAQSSQILDSISQINQLARRGQFRSAMEEAYLALQTAPTYLPLHSLIADLLVREGHTEEAMAKFTVIATAYGVRGESSQATKMLRRVIELAPMDLNARTRLIDQLIERGEVNEAINEYLEVADIYYRLAELDMARKTYTNALRVVQQANADRSWNVHILQRMADIDMQRLDWKQAMRVFEQIRTLRPDDVSVRKSLIDLNLRLAQEQQAVAELENYLSYLNTNGKGNQVIPFLEELVNENGDRIILRRTLAEQYKQAGQNEATIVQLDDIGKILVEQGKVDEAANTVQQILLLNPPNAEQYQRLLQKLLTR